MGKHFDTLGRRRRATPSSTGKRLTLQPADLIWLERLVEHGPLPSSYLLAFTRHLRRSDKRATERLTDLFNEDSTQHGGHYLVRPPQQFRTIDSRYNQLVYDLGEAGQRALAERGLATTGSNQGCPWLHRLMVACVTASIELGAEARPDLSYIPGSIILARATAPLRYPIANIDPETKARRSQDLVPDALFGLTYHTPQGDRYRFFVTECDRATEPLTGANGRRKSWQRALRHYQAYIARGAYKTHLKLTAPLLVLNVTSDPMRQIKMIALTEREQGACSYQLFQAWDAFGPLWRPPSPHPGLIEQPWQRAGQRGLEIGRP